MTPKLVVPLLVAAGILISACDDTATSSPPAGNSAETAARSACLNAVIGETGNPDAAVLSSDFSEAGTMVTVGVGSQRAPWQCIAYSDGTTDGIQSLTDEGFL